MCEIHAIADAGSNFAGNKGARLDTPILQVQDCARSWLKICGGKT
jgi:hypothetical protein